MSASAKPTDFAALEADVRLLDQGAGLAPLSRVDHVRMQEAARRLMEHLAAAAALERIAADASAP